MVPEIFKLQKSDVRSPRNSFKLLQKQNTRGPRDSCNYFKNKTKGIPEILSNYIKNQTQGMGCQRFIKITSKTRPIGSSRNSFKLLQKPDTKSPWDSFIIHTSETKLKGVADILSNCLKNNTRDAQDSFNLLQKPSTRGPQDSFKLFWWRKIRVQRDSFRLLQKENKRGPRDTFKALQ